MGVSERRQRQTEALREQILDAAEQIIVREGAARVTMRRIAASVEYSPTVLYRLFHDKNDLMDHLLVRGYEGVRARYREVISREGLDPAARLAAILTVYAEYALAHPNHYRMFFDTGEIRLVDGELMMTHGRLTYVVFQVWLDAIESCRAAGLFPDRAAIATFQVLWPRVHGLISLRLQHPGLPWPPLTQHLSDVVGLPPGA